jgi:hypothetical protein
MSGSHSPGDEGDSKHLRNTGKLLPDYTLPLPRRQPSSHSNLRTTVGTVFFFFALFTTFKELRNKYKEEVEGYFEVISQHFHGGSEDSQRKPVRTTYFWSQESNL